MVKICDFLGAGALALVLSACGAGGAGQPANEAPTVTVTAPAQDVEIGLSRGGTIDITYTDADPDSDATTDLIADRDGDPRTTGDQVVIARDLPEQDGAEQTIAWDASTAPAGSYKILALTRDAESRALATAPGGVALNAASSLQIVEPSGDHIVSRGGMLSIDYVDDDPDDVAVTWIRADADGDPSTSAPGDRSTAPRFEMDGAQQRVTMDNLPLGTYTILGATWDGTNTPAEAQAAGRVHVRNVGLAKSFGGTGSDAAFEVATSADGTFIVAGEYSDGTVFGANEANETTLGSNGFADAFVARYEADGTLAFVRGFGGTVPDRVTDVATYADGSFVATGSIGRTVTIGAGEPNETTLAVSSETIFVARFNADGTLAYARSGNASGVSRGNAVATSPDGSCLVTGQVVSPVTLGVGEPNETTLERGGFVARYAPDGALVFARGFGSECTAGQTFRDNSFIVGGTFSESITFGAGEPNETTLSQPGASSANFVARFNADGTLAFAKRLGPDHPVLQSGLDLSVYADESLLIAGYFSGSVTFGEGDPAETTLTSSGRQDVYFARYDAQGALIYVKSVGSSVSDDRPYDVESFDDGSFVLTGLFSGEVTLGEGEANETTLPAGGFDGFVARFREDGSLVYAKGMPATGLSIGQGIGAFSDGSFIVTGLYGGQITIAPTEANETTLTAVDRFDAFIVRYNADGGL